MEFVRYVAISTVAMLAVVVLCATVQQWDERDAATTLACQKNRCT